jgi:hypothetical protein
MRAELLRLHALAAAAIVPGLDFAAWHDAYFVPLVCTRVDAWVLVARSADAATEQAHVRLRAEFYPREGELLTRAQLAATQPKSRAPRRKRLSPRATELQADAI